MSSAMLEEYKLIRTENLASISAQKSTLTFGITLISFLGSAAGYLWKEGLFSEAILTFLIPVVAIFVTIMWLGEVVRMARASRFLWELERLFNNDFRRDLPCGSGSLGIRIPRPLAWESWVRGRNSWRETITMKHTYLATLSLFTTISVASLIIGNFLFLTKHQYGYWIYSLLIWWDLSVGAVIYEQFREFYRAADRFGGKSEKPKSKE